MRIVEARKVEDCFDGGAVYAYRFDNVWTERDIRALATLGKLEYYPEFPRPLFRLLGEGGWQVKGILGEDECKVVLPRTGRESIRQRFEQQHSDPS
ncbi:MAG TPA: hypothetical protein VLH79_02315 [Chthonomonadales bacterium]|nr:hypothetical protein [Chthonomonadales bacterium]